MLSINYNVHHEDNRQNRANDTTTRRYSTLHNCSSSMTSTQPFQNIYPTDTFLDDDDDDVTILFNGTKQEGFEDRISLYHNACLRYDDVVNAGPPVQALEFPKPTINRAIHCDARVLDHRSGRVQETTVLMKHMSDDHKESHRSIRAYLLGRKLSKTTSNGLSTTVRLCKVLRRRMTTYDGRNNNRHSTTAEWKTTDEIVVIKMSQLLTKRSGGKQYEVATMIGSSSTYNRVTTKTATGSRNNGLIKGMLFVSLDTIVTVFFSDEFL
jgi:hypothetical protein